MISHSLQIELGRHRRPKVPRESRLCTCGSVETEVHFVTQCTQYTHIRHMFNINENDDISYLLERNDICNYISKLFDCRKFYSDATWRLQFSYHYGPMNFKDEAFKYLYINNENIFKLAFLTVYSIRSIITLLLYSFFYYKKLGIRNPGLSSPKN